MGRERKSTCPRHVALYHYLLESPAYISLSYSAKALLNDMLMTFNGGNNGNISATLSQLKVRGWNSSGTLSKALRELEDKGFIVKVRQGGITRGSKHCSLFRFTHLPCYDKPALGIKRQDATHDYRKWSPDSPKSEKSKLRKMELIDAEFESKSVQKSCNITRPKVLKIEQEKCDVITYFH